MLTSLHIKTYKDSSRLKSFFRLFMFDTMVVEIKRVDDIKVKCIEYNNRSNSINWKKIGKEIGAQRNRLLCKKSIELPKNSGYKRFCSNEYKERLCTNLAISLLSSLQELNIKVGLIDMDAHFTTLPQYLLRYTDSVVVVSDKTDIYKEVNENLLCETGAPVRLSKSLRSLYNCDLVIAPHGLAQVDFIKENTLVLTTQKLVNQTGATIIYDYHTELDEKYKKLLPAGLGETYFASALYTLMKVYTLGSVLPDLCISENKIHTPSSLKVILNNISAKNLT